MKRTYRNLILAPSESVGKKVAERNGCHEDHTMIALNEDELDSVELEDKGTVYAVSSCELYGWQNVRYMLMKMKDNGHNLLTFRYV